MSKKWIRDIKWALIHWILHLLLGLIYFKICVVYDNQLYVTLVQIPPTKTVSPLWPQDLNNTSEEFLPCLLDLKTAYVMSVQPPPVPLGRYSAAKPRNLPIRTAGSLLNGTGTNRVPVQEEAY
jgi:hypothetical protein